MPALCLRRRLEYAPGANDGTAGLFNVAGAPFLGVTSDFGTDFIYAGAAFYVPFGGGARWSKNDAYQNDPDFPGAYDGQQRWYAVDGSLRSMYVTGALAFKIEAARLTLGVSGSAIFSSMDTIRARNADGTDNLVSGTMPGKPLPDGSPGPNLYCAVIVKRVDAKTRAKTSINELLRA